MTHMSAFKRKHDVSHTVEVRLHPLLSSKRSLRHCVALLSFGQRMNVVVVVQSPGLGRGKGELLRSGHLP